MAIAGPETPWETFKRTTGFFDVGAAVVTFGASVPAAYRFFSTGDDRWGWFVIGMATLALIVQCGKAYHAYQEQRCKDSVHELQGCLHTLETVLLGPDLDPKRRFDAGLRLTIHTPDGQGYLKQVMDYVGDQRAQTAIGRRMPENAGVAGHAYQQARLQPPQPQLFYGCRTTSDYDAFLGLMVSSYAFTLDGARKLNPATMAWLALAITNGGQVHGVLYCDAKQADFFTDSRREDILNAMAGIAFFVGLRYR